MTTLADSAQLRGYEKLIEAFGGEGYYAADPRTLANALAEAGFGPAGADQLRDRSEGGTESGYIGNLNPQSSIASKK